MVCIRYLYLYIFNIIETMEDIMLEEGMWLWSMKRSGSTPWEDTCRSRSRRSRSTSCRMPWSSWSKMNCPVLWISSGESRAIKVRLEEAYRKVVLSYLAKDRGLGYLEMESHL